MFNFLAGRVNFYDSNERSYNFSNKNLQDIIKKSYSKSKNNSNLCEFNIKILNLLENFVENHWKVEYYMIKENNDV